ncbi:MAG: beta-ketoacyl synthase N-terminal-like domain-containing protein [Sphaerochaetaceae bacterium]|nr:beta-ketoacyl synthase N-terminal-like domain-containing protein [Spirochaetales bacterium]MDY5499110.1 beta-ketoacyl synthase N-terminal-like domain-containing protein [Sphaerochaetaceae bacterium]
MPDRIALSHPFVITNLAQDPLELYHAVLAGKPAFSSMQVYGKSYLFADVPARYEDKAERSYHKGMCKALVEGYLPVVASLRERYGKDRVALLVATCDYQSEWSTPAMGYYFAHQSFPQGYTLYRQSPAWSVDFLQGEWDLEGIGETLSTACSTGAGMLARARDLIEAGFADAVVAVGYDLAYDVVCMGFDSLGVYATEGTNPSSLNRKGVTLGTGLGALAVTAGPQTGDWVLLGVGESNDAYHITGPDPEGNGAEACMRRALSDASLEPEDIGYINLHGTGTHANDLMEALAIDRIFGCSVPVSSTKSLTGHTLGASGAIETILCMETLAHGMLPPHVFDGVRDPALPPLTFVEQGKRYPRPRACMSNSFAFGGNNVSVIVGVEE